MKSLFSVFVSLYLCNLATSAYEKSTLNLYCGKHRRSMIINRKYNGSSDVFNEAYLIHPSAVLTMAYAVDGLLKEELEVIDSHQDPSKNASFNVSKIIIHPQYIPCSGTKGIAILILETPIEDHSHEPICLPDRKIDGLNAPSKCSGVNIDKTFFRNLNADIIEVGTIGFCINKMPHGFYPNIKDSACKLNRSQSLDLFKRRESTFRTCELYEKETGDIRHYLYQYYFFAPFRSVNEDQSHGYEVVYHKEDVYHSVRWIHSVLSETVGKVRDSSLSLSPS